MAHLAVYIGRDLELTDQQKQHLDFICFTDYGKNFGQIIKNRYDGRVGTFHKNLIREYVNLYLQS